MPAQDVIVVGAGIVGAAIAHVLAAEGLDVLVVDAPMRTATDAGMGHLVVMDEPEPEFALSREGLRLWHAWKPLLDERSAFRRCGTLWVAADAAEWTLAQAKHRRMLAQGIAAELLDPHALANAEPELRRGLAGGLRVAGDAIVFAPLAARALLERAARPIRRVAARVVALSQGAVRLHDDRRLHAAAIVLAAGAHASRLAPELPLLAKKGQLLVTDRCPGFVRHQLVELGYAASAHAASGASVAFNVQPRPTGQLLIGSSRQFDRDDAAVDAALLGRMLRRAVNFLPHLGRVHGLRAWTGLRPATPDGLPLIGAHPTRRGLWLALGHEGLGVTTAPATARLLAALMLGRDAAFDPGPFAPARFLAPIAARASAAGSTAAVCP